MSIESVFRAMLLDQSLEIVVKVIFTFKKRKQMIKTGTNLEIVRNITKVKEIKASMIFIRSFILWCRGMGVICSRFWRRMTFSYQIRPFIS